jgi:hypothetical protein
MIINITSFIVMYVLIENKEFGKKLLISRLGYKFFGINKVWVYLAVFFWVMAILKRSYK